MMEETLELTVDVSTDEGSSSPLALTRLLNFQVMYSLFIYDISAFVAGFGMERIAESWAQLS